MKKLLLLAMIIAFSSTAAVYAADKTYTGQYLGKQVQKLDQKEQALRAQEKARKDAAAKARQDHENAVKAEQKKYEDAKKQTRQKVDIKKQQFNDLKKF